MTTAQSQSEISKKAEEFFEYLSVERAGTQIAVDIAEIPTRLYLPSECDRALLVAAAAKVVAQNQQEIEDFLAGRSTPERTTQ